MRFYVEGTRSMVPLEAVSERDWRWNGFHVPIATEAQVRDFLARWEDFFGTGDGWGHSITVRDDALVVCFADRDSVETWERVGRRIGDNAPLYAIDGWMWEAED